MNRKRFGGRRKLNVQLEMEKLSEEKQLIIKELMHDFEAHQSDRQSELDERKRRTLNAIRQQFQSCIMQIPSNLQKLTIHQIITSGGSLQLINDDNQEVQILIAKSLLETNNSNELSQVMANKSRQAFNDMSAAINSASGKKKNNLDASNRAMVLKVPLISSSPNKTGTRLLRSAAKVNQTTSTITKTNANVSRTRVLRTVEKTRHQEVIIEENSVIQVSSSQTNVTNITKNTDSDVFKTPFVKSASIPFLTKPPRKPVENEEIINIFCSTSGTPLLVDEKSLNRVVTNSQ